MPFYLTRGSGQRAQNGAERSPCLFSGQDTDKDPRPGPSEAKKEAACALKHLQVCISSFFLAPHCEYYR